jgi:hypothetical protein
VSDYDRVRKLRIMFGTGRTSLVPIADDYKIAFVDGWLWTPTAVFAEREILSVQIVEETTTITNIKAA